MTAETPRIGPSPTETAGAQALRGRRQTFAAPGGQHDRLVRLLARGLPMGVGIVAALMVITPFSQRGEVSFLLDRNKVAQIDERLSVDKAMYRGRDIEGRPFSLLAGEAVQRSGVEGLVRMHDLVAQILLSDGPAKLSAGGGVYDIRSEVVAVEGPVQFSASDGYAMTANGVSVDLRSRTMRGEKGVSGEVPAGAFSADTLRADLAARTITLEGHARFTMIPGQTRMPRK
jgi:lipopolysaccharide export system protein LptC